MAKKGLPREGWIFPVGETVESWAKRYGIEPLTCPCPRCGVDVTTTVPFAKKTLRGLVAPPCEKCGNTSTPYCMVRAAWAGDLLDGDL